MTRRLQSTLLLILALTSGSKAEGIVNPGAYNRLEKDAEFKAKEKVEGLLEKYCGGYCQLVDIKAELDEEIPVTDDIGFESVMGEAVQAEVFVRKLIAEILIDNRVNTLNQDRLGKILTIHLRPLAMEPLVQWNPVALPSIAKGHESDDTLLNPLTDTIPEPAEIQPGVSEAQAPVAPAPIRVQGSPELIVDDSVEAMIKSQIEARLLKALTKVTERYCPDQCIIERFLIEGEMISAQDAKGFPSNQVFKEDSGKAAFRVQNIDVDVTMADSIEEEARERIVNLMRTHTKFVQPLNLNVSVTAFPETHKDKTERAKKESEDPYGLERLRQMLAIFREMAGTKEIITNTTTNTNSTSESMEKSSSSQEVKSSSSSHASSVEKEQNTNSSTEKNRDISSVESKTGLFGLSTEELAMYGAGFLVLITILAIAFMKFSTAKRDAAQMLMVPGGGMARQGAAMGGAADDWAMPLAGGAADNAGVPGAAPEKAGPNFSLAMKVKELKDELIELFLENPRVAKDTFSRFLKEDGVEETAKYVHVFGHLIVFQLLEDPNFQRELYELSEYYHNSNFQFTMQEEFNLLMKLKTRCTASEIRVLTRKELEKFDFLSKLDPAQIYALVQDENVQVQAIVLAQLDPKRRRAVFDMYQGQMKIKLMSQLSTSEAIPKEFMMNVAKALSKKVAKKPEFDTENLRSSDVLLDLLEKASLHEQRQLMATLAKQNADTARSLKMKLVTVEMMPFLKDGHLLELILGMDRRDLLVFLAGTQDHIRDLLLRKAPEELSDSWIEDLHGIGSVDEQSYRMVEMKVLNRIRNLANNGVISLMDINSMLFDNATEASSQFQEEEAGMNLPNNGYVAA